MTSRWLRPSLILILGLGPAIAAAGMWLARGGESSAESVLFLFLLLPFVAVGALLVYRVPDNLVSWLVTATGIAIALNGFSDEYLSFAVDRDLPGAHLASFGSGLGFFAMVAIGGGLLPLFFPTGKPPSHRWRWVWIASLLGLIAIAVGSIAPTFSLSTSELLEGVPLESDNPVLMALLMGGLVLIVVATVAGLVSLFFRYRRSEGTERLQLRWFLIGVMIVVAGVLIELTLENSLSLALLAIGFTALPVSIAVAILRYRLYDIDLVISRTLVFGVLAVFISGVYVGIVVGLGSLVGGGGEPNLGLSVVATGLVAVLFEPVRLRAQSWANRVVFGRRASPYQVLAGLTARLGETTSDESLLERLAASLGEGTGAGAVVWLRIGDRFRAAASSDGVLPVGNVMVGEELEDADLVVPVVHEGESLGLLSLVAARGAQVSPADERLVSDVAGNVGLMLRNVRLNTELVARAEELAESRRRLVAVQDEERRRLERDLHDGAQQHVVAAAMQLNMARMIALKEGHDRVAAQLGELVDLDQQAVEQLRTIARGIYPPLLEAEGLQAAIQGAARSLPIAVNLQAGDLPRYPQDVEAAVYFCATETIRDALRRGAGTATVTLTGEQDTVEVEIADDGAGDPGSQTLQALTDRVGAAGGELTNTTTGIHISLRAGQLAEVPV